MNTLPLFDYALSQAAKESGMRRAAKKQSVELERARAIARYLARDGREVTADDVQKVLIAEGIDLKNSAGAIFTNGEFEAVSLTRSKKVIGHGNRILVWKLKG